MKGGDRGAARVLIVSVFAVAATVAGLAVAKPWTPSLTAATLVPDGNPSPEPTRSPEREPPPSREPLDVRRFNGTLEASMVSPTGHVILGPTSDNHVEFDAGSRGSYLIAEVAWESDRVRDLGAVLFVYRGSELGYGYVTTTTDLNWEDVSYVTGPSPLYLTMPIDPGARYSWSVYPLTPGQVIVHLDFKSAVSVFETMPTADYRVFPPSS